MTTLALEAAPLTVRRSSLIAAVLCVYASLAPLGSLVRFSGSETALGVTTILLLLAVMIALPDAFRVMTTNFVFQAFALLIAWMLMMSVFAVDPLLALYQGATLVVYLAAAATAFVVLGDPGRVLAVLLLFAVGGLVSSAATIVDFVGIVDLPGVNEVAKGTPTDVGTVIQASGVFPRRSSMAAYYVLIITPGLLVALFGAGLARGVRMLLLASALSCIVALSLTHARAGVLAPLIVTLLVVLLRSRSVPGLLRTTLIAALGMLALWFMVVTFFPQVWIAYQALLRFGDVASATAALDASDTLRLVLAKRALMALAENPLGHGYSWVSAVPGHVSALDPHNIITQVVWGAGVFGLVWVLGMALRALPVTMMLRWRGLLDSTTGQIWLAVVGALLAFFLNNMMHTSLSTGMAWLYFGAALRLGARLRENGGAAGDDVREAAA